MTVEVDKTELDNTELKTAVVRSADLGNRLDAGFSLFYTKHKPVADELMAKLGDELADLIRLMPIDRDAAAMVFGSNYSVLRVPTNHEALIKKLFAYTTHREAAVYCAAVLAGYLPRRHAEQVELLRQGNEIGDNRFSVKRYLRRNDLDLALRAAESDDGT